MNFFRKNPLFAFVLTLCALLVLGELALTYERFAASRACRQDGSCRARTGSRACRSSRHAADSRELRLQLRLTSRRRRPRSVLHAG
jgi:hypothetical protein